MRQRHYVGVFQRGNTTRAAQRSDVLHRRVHDLRQRRRRSPQLARFRVRARSDAHFSAGSAVTETAVTAQPGRIH